MSRFARVKLFACAGIALACLLLLACGSTKEQTSCVPPDTVEPTATPFELAVYPGADWETSSPEAEGMAAAPLENIDPYCVEHGCRAVVVIRHGRIVWERYWGGWDKDSTDNSWSVAKSVTSALVGIALKEGKLKSLGQSASDFIPAWQGTDLAKITLRHLLTMESGRMWHMLYSPPDGDTIKMLGLADQVEYALTRPLYREPGTDWYYSDGDTQTFSHILKVATGMEAGQYAQEKLFAPIGIRGAEWRTDDAGQTLTYCCIISTARDFARFGYLYLRGGKWEDRQVVPADWVRESVQPSQIDNLNYGYYWWLHDFPGAPTDMYTAIGFATKRLYVIPSLDIVAVRLGEGDDLLWNDSAFLRPIVDAANGG